MVVRNERTIGGRKRVQNYVCGKLFAHWEAKPFHRLQVTNHLDYVRAKWIAVFQLTSKRRARYIVPFRPCLCLKHALEHHDHIAGLNFLELLLQVRLHMSEHKTSDFNRLILSSTIGISGGSWLIIFWLNSLLG